MSYHPTRSGREAVHRDPVWRDRADFIIAIEIDPEETDVVTEQLWARRVGASQFQLCCIPFFACDVALGDVVEVGAGLLVQRVVAASGRFVFRVHFPPTTFGVRDSVVEALAGMGALLEWSSESLLAVDAQDEGHARQVSGYLCEQENAGRLLYETGKSA